MTAKEYLSEALKYRRAMNTLKERAESLRTELIGLKAITYDRDRVQISPTNKIEELMPRLIEIEERYGEMIFKYHKALLIRTAQVEEIGRDDYAEILRLRYLETNAKGKRHSLNEIAEKTHRSFDWVRHLHGQALRAFERKYLKTTHKNT